MTQNCHHWDTNKTVQLHQTTTIGSQCPLMKLLRSWALTFGTLRKKKSSNSAQSTSFQLMKGRSRSWMGLMLTLLAVSLRWECLMNKLITDSIQILMNTFLDWMNILFTGMKLLRNLEKEVLVLSSNAMIIKKENTALSRYWKTKRDFTSRALWKQS